MVPLKTFIEGEKACTYLPDRPSRLEYTVVLKMSPAEYEAHMNRGYRKFGPLLFRPMCAACRECRSLRIPVTSFAPDRSQRRSLRRNADLEVRFARPTVDDARLDLYNRYHAAQEGRKGWTASEKTTATYTFSFLNSPVPGVEVSVWEGDVLRAVALTDITPNAVSGIYHYHEPGLSDRGLGTFTMLQTIELARRLNKPWAYFGYYVADCSSLAYKIRFRPCELLGDDGEWHPVGAGTDAAFSGDHGNGL
jgi:arginine-tRNA-protein transferase